MMNVIVFGATGSVGRHLVQQGLAQGHTVTAFVRSAKRLGQSHDRLNVIEGDVLNAADVLSAVAGQDAVLITLGAGIRGRIRAEGTRNIILAMKQHGVNRLICQSTLGAGESHGNLNLKWRFLFGVPLRLAMRDHEIQEQYVRESGLDWTIIRPSAFTDELGTGTYHFNFPATWRHLQLKIPRADVAGFMLKELQERHFDRQAVSIST